MRRSHQIAGHERGDRLSSLRDVVLGHVLSFLDAKEIARATTLSRRWRDVLAIVHTVSLGLEQPKQPLAADDLASALFNRVLRQAPAAVPVPLRALRARVCMGYHSPEVDETTMDQCVSYALMHAGPELELDLRLGSDTTICKHPNPAAEDLSLRVPPRKPTQTNAEDHSLLAPHDDDDGDDVGSSSEEDLGGDREHALPTRRFNYVNRDYTVPWGIFSCAALRSLHLGSCRLSPPAAFRMPWLQELRLTHAPDEEEHVQRLVSACPHLVDLSLEACQTVTTLSVLGNMRLRSLSLLCCHKLAKVSVDATELRAFEYRGAVPSDSFLTIVGSSPSITSCKIDICVICVGEATSEDELGKLGSFLQHFASSTKHLHLSCALMCSCFVRLPAFTSLCHLQLIGRVPHSGDDPAAVAVGMSKILRQAPNLETLSLLFEIKRRDPNKHDYYSGHNEAELLDPHLLHYNKYDTIDVPASLSLALPTCLGTRLRKINLLHYQGGRAQRMLVKFLVCNAKVLEKLYCGFAEGPMWIQTKLKREMEDWALNETTNKEFR
ncbi:hypothetical protein ZWY2020_027233 [Hordeum vulgare]|nr:hypothetical protein ZWY2020_027233 [Hordeum vulgare]